MSTYTSVAAVAVGCLASQAAATDGPINWWTFDSVGAVTVSPAAGAASGTVFAPAAIVAGGVGPLGLGALDTRNGGWVNFGPILPLTSGDFTISVWVLSNNATNNSTSVAGRFATGSANGYALRVNLDAAGFGDIGAASFYQSGTPGTTAVGTSTVIDGANWHHIAATYVSGGSLRLYVDGMLDANVPARAILPSTAPFLVGGIYSTPSAATVNAFSGLIDDLQVYDRALTADEVAFLTANPGRSVPTPAAAGVLLGLAAATRRRRAAR